MTIAQLLTWFFQDIAKDVGGKDPGIGKTLAEKKQFLLFATIVYGLAAVGGGLAWWPVAIPFGLISIRKFWIYNTITG